MPKHTLWLLRALIVSRPAEGAIPRMIWFEIVVKENKLIIRCVLQPVSNNVMLLNGLAG